MDHKQRGFKATVVGLADKTVCIYKDKFLVNKISTPDVVSAILFGKFGREDGSLVMVNKGEAKQTLLQTLCLCSKAAVRHKDKTTANSRQDETRCA